MGLEKTYRYLDKLKRKDIMYDYKKTLKKGIKYFVLFGLPWLVSLFIKEFPAIANITVGTLLLMATDFIKHKYKITLGGLL